VSEPREIQPGSRIHAQYLLARMFDYLVDETPTADPFIVRLWEMSAILKAMLQDEQVFYTNDLYPMIQSINQRM
jgi:hypothetical protein